MGRVGDRVAIYARGSKRSGGFFYYQAHFFFSLFLVCSCPLSLFLMTFLLSMKQTMNESPTHIQNRCSHIRILSNLRLLTADEGRKKVNVSKFLNKRALKKKIHLRTQSLN